MKKITILVAQHKVANVFRNDVYRPIHVGKALSDIDIDAIPDNTGENISLLNPYYCELTAQYWAWKNIHDTEYVGLCHYRRYFKQEFTNENVDSLMNDCDIVLSKRLYLSIPILVYWYQGLVPEDIDTFWLYMLKHEGGDREKFIRYFLVRDYMNPANMFVCKKKLFDEFCEWQFGILEDLRRILPLQGHCREKRILGYFAEGLLPYFAYKKGWRIKEMPLVSYVGDKITLNNQSRTDIIRNKIKFKIKQPFNHRIMPDRQVSLERDGILKAIEDCN